jgi:ribosomal protein S18 acetylase RimI-like enzyme
MITVRPTVDSDKEHLLQWFQEDDILKWYPMSNQKEIDDAVRLIWANLSFGVVLTAELDGVPCGIINLYLQAFEKIKHQALFAIIVKSESRGKGVGTALISRMIEIAREKNIELLHLEVYENNPAINLYKRMGFTIYGRQEKFINENGVYSAKILMQKKLC